MTSPKSNRFVAVPLLLAGAAVGAWLPNAFAPKQPVHAATLTPAAQQATVTIIYQTLDAPVSSEHFNVTLGASGTWAFALPAGYELAPGQPQELTYKATTPTNVYRIRVQKTTATPTQPATVPVTVTYLAQNKIIKRDQFVGTVGATGHYDVQLPQGYQLAAGQDASLAYTLHAGTNQLVVQLTKTARATVPATVTYLAQGKVIKQAQFVGTVGETGRYDVSVPHGYHLAEGQAARFNYTLKAGTNSFVVQLTPAVMPTVPATVTYLYQGQAVKREQFAGKMGETGRYDLDVPFGYTLAAGQAARFNYTLKAGMNEYVVQLSKPTLPTVPATVTYLYQGQAIKREQFAGKMGETGRYDLDVPFGYTLAAGQAARFNYTLTAGMNEFVVQLSKPITPSVPATISYLYQGQAIKLEQFVGKLGETGYYYVDLPQGYELAAGQSDRFSYTLTAGMNEFVVQLTKPTTPTVPVTVTYLYQGQAIKREQFVGKLGETGAYTVTVPQGYALAAGQADRISYTLTAGMNEFSVELIKAVTPTVPATVTYLYQGQVVKQAQLTGKLGATGTYTVDLPAGYALAKGQAASFTYTLTAGTNQFVVQLTKPVATAAATVTYVDAQGKIVKQDQFTGPVGATGHYAVTLPAGYQLASGQAAGFDYTLQAGTNHFVVQLTKPVTTAAATVTYVDAQGNIVKQDQFTGQVGTSGHYTVTLPAGYQLASGQAAGFDYTLQAGTNHFVVQLTKPVATAAATVTYVDAQGKIVKQDQFTGPLGSAGVYQATAPSGYQFATGQASQITYTLHADPNQLVVHLVKTAAKVPATITYLYQGQTVKVDNFVGTVGEFGTRPLTVPTGYMLTGSALLSYRLTAGSNQFTVLLSKAKPLITVTVVDHDTRLPLATVTITGEAGTPMQFNRHELTLPYLKQGYEIVHDATAEVTRFPERSQNLTIAVQKKAATHDFSRPLPSVIAAALPQPAGKPVATTGDTTATEAQRDRPMVFTPFGLGGQSHGGHGGGGGAAGSDSVAAALVLASYWQALSGTINFGASN